MSETKRTPEPWVDAATVAAHLGFKADYIRKQAVSGKLPGKQFKNGARSYWRFRISEIDAALSSDEITASIVSPLAHTLPNFMGIAWNA